MYFTINRYHLTYSNTLRALSVKVSRKKTGVILSRWGEPNSLPYFQMTFLKIILANSIKNPLVAVKPVYFQQLKFHQHSTIFFSFDVNTINKNLIQQIELNQSTDKNMSLKYVSSNIDNTKKMLNILLAIIAFTAPILCANPSQSLGDYPPHAHPFAKVGSQFSQSSGDKHCRSLFDEYKFAHPQFYGSEPVSLSTSPLTANTAPKFYRVYANDRVEITFASHIWYHQRNGECIANIGKY